MIRFTKATAAPPKPKKPTGEKKAALDKLRSFLAQAEPEAAEFLVSFWDSQALGITYAELREAYLAGDLPPQRYRQWTQEYSSFIQDRLAPAWRQAADAGAAEIRARYPHFVYEPSMGAAMDYIRQHGAELVTNITAEQHNALRALVAHVSGYTAITPDEAARIIRPCIGLTKPQALANARYREKLKNSIYEAHRKAHPNGSPEKAAQIAERKAQEAAARYAARQHRYRAQNIARTELAFAYNAGAYGATKDAQAQGYIGACVKVWLTAYDERVCPICSAMDDEKRGMDEPFSNGKLLPPAHPSCRCAVAYEEIPGTNVMPSMPENMDSAPQQGSSAPIQPEAVSAPAPVQPAQPPIRPAVDVTQEYLDAAAPNSHTVQDLQSYTVNGVTYTVDGHNVILDYSPHEKGIAELLERKLGGEIFMVPRVNNPSGVRTPDYLFRGKPYDLKTLKPNAGPNTIFNRVKKAYGQAQRFIIDVTNSGIDDATIDQQIEKLFDRSDTDWLEEVVIIRGTTIFRIAKRA